MKKFIKNTAPLLCFLTLSAGLFAFDWPQFDIVTESFHSYFGQVRNGTIQSSLTFADTAEVYSADKGTVTLLITEHDNDFGWFESTLGNALIMNHDNNMMTVYANLDEETLSEEIFNDSSDTSRNIKSGEYLGTSGNSAWQKDQSSLEFFVLDCQNRSVINPRVLMPKIGKEIPLEITDLYLMDRNGNFSSIKNTRRLQSELYYIYKNRQTTAVPYKTIFAVNGITIETISYDHLTEKDGKLCVQGNSLYDAKTVYPDEGKQLLAVTTLTRGKNTFTVTLVDIDGKSVTTNYTIEIY